MIIRVVLRSDACGAFDQSGLSITVGPTVMNGSDRSDASNRSIDVIII